MALQARAIRSQDRARARASVGAGIRRVLIGQGDDRQLAMQPSRLSEFITLVRERFEEAAREGEAPVLVDIIEHPAIRARHCRTFSGADAGALAGRDPSPRPPEDSQQHLVWVSPAANRRQRAETARKVAVKPRKIR